MKPKEEEYYDTGTDKDFLAYGAMNKKIELFTTFLIRAGIEFKLKDFNGGKIIELENNTFCYFHKTGRTEFNNE